MSTSVASSRSCRERTSQILRDLPAPDRRRDEQAPRSDALSRVWGEDARSRQGRSLATSLVRQEEREETMNVEIVLPVWLAVVWAVILAVWVVTDVVDLVVRVARWWGRHRLAKDYANARRNHVHIVTRRDV